MRRCNNEFAISIFFAPLLREGGEVVGEEFWDEGAPNSGEELEERSSLFNPTSRTIRANESSFRLLIVCLSFSEAVDPGGADEARGRPRACGSTCFDFNLVTAAWTFIKTGR